MRMSNRNYNKNRLIHHYLAPIALILLTINAITGLLYTILKNVFQIPKERIKWLMVIHQGNLFDSDGFKTFYCALLALLLILGVVFTGFSMLRFNSKPLRSMRQFHHQFAIVFWVPLAIIVASGGIYRVVRYFNLVEKHTAHMLIWFHAGTCFNTVPRITYVACISLCVLTLSVSGILIWIRSNFVTNKKYQTKLVSYISVPTREQ
jgi:hypothetical protein